MHHKYSATTFNVKKLNDFDFMLLSLMLKNQKFEMCGFKAVRAVLNFARKNSS